METFVFVTGKHSITGILSVAISRLICNLSLYPFDTQVCSSYSLVFRRDTVAPKYMASNSDLERKGLTVLTSDRE